MAITSSLIDRLTDIMILLSIDREHSDKVRRHSCRQIDEIYRQNSQTDDRKRDKEIHRHADREKERQINSQTDRQTNGERDKETDNPIERYTVKMYSQIETHIERQRNRLTDIQTAEKR
jgi:hypothetical protein